MANLEKKSRKDKKKRESDVKSDEKHHKKQKILKDERKQDVKADVVCHIDEEKINQNVSVEDPFENKEWKRITSFKESEISSKILAGTSGFAAPTPIQSVCWPILMAGRDIIGIAETGSGKTLAFALPALNKVYKMHKKNDQKKMSPTVLVMTPTRELALQIQEQIGKFSEKIDCKSLCVFGGIPKHEQREKLRGGIDVIVACPGRLHDLMSEGSCDISNVKYVVLDEADRLLDAGFEKEIKEILSNCCGKKQMAMFSATWPTSVEKLACEYLSKAVKVTIGSQDLGANAKITQIVEVLQPENKESRLLDLLKKYHSSRANRVIVFALYKKEAARLERFLKAKGWNCVCIQGDMSQESRTKSFQQFKSGQVPLLIATDVAARGLDIPKVEYVINFTFPLTIEDYVHRIGRTGRAGREGTSHTFFTFHEKSKSGELINLLKQTDQIVPSELMAFGTTVKKKEHSAYGAFFKEVDLNVKGTKITFGSDDDE